MELVVRFYPWILFFLCYRVPLLRPFNFCSLLLTNFVKRVSLLLGWLEMLSLHSFMVWVIPSCQAASVQQAGNWSRTLRVNLASPAADTKSIFSFLTKLPPSGQRGNAIRQNGLKGLGTPTPVPVPSLVFFSPFCVFKCPTGSGSLYFIVPHPWSRKV